ncbi:MAG: SPOR domain-containing protein [Deltaproteobacteria bacterium]|mgnify:CR=1 FL=1|nr:SPOR domain-containing protein [Deltaproteobacteria bacterium]
MTEYMRSRRRDEGGDGFFCRFTFGQFFALLVLEVFTLFFVFYLGARYGREFLGLERSREMAGAEELIDESGSGGHVLNTSDPEAREVAKKLIAETKSPELKDRIRQMINNAQKKEEVQRPKVVERNIVERQEEKEIREIPPSEKRVQNEEPRKESISSEDLAASNNSSVIRVKSADNARYSVQVGSYPNMKEATRVIEKWKGKGYPAYMMIADIPDRGRWYRVRLGGFENRSDASSYMKELKSRESVEALVVLNEQ